MLVAFRVTVGEGGRNERINPRSSDPIVKIQITNVVAVYVGFASTVGLRNGFITPLGIAIGVRLWICVALLLGVWKEAEMNASLRVEFCLRQLGARTLRQDGEKGTVEAAFRRMRKMNRWLDFIVAAIEDVYDGMKEAEEAKPHD